MFYSLDIQYPEERMRANKLRLEATCGFKFRDRVPVLLGIEPRYLLHTRGTSFEEYFSDPRTQIVQQLENIKWRIENIPDDWMTVPSLTLTPDFQNVTNASGVGCEIFWQKDETPHAVQAIATLDEMEKHQLPDWKGTLWGKKVEWFHVMRELVTQVEVSLNGTRIPVHVSLSINGDGPFMSAVELAGENFYTWLLEEPAACHQFLRKITDRYIDVETEYRRISGRPMRDGMNYSDDSAQIISLQQYREFCVPVAARFYETFGCDRFDGRLMHMCGRNVHLHPALLDDLHITMLHGFGSANRLDEMGFLAGRVILQGNLDPVLLADGSASEIEASTVKILDTLGAAGGLILGDGYNIVPGTSLEKLSVIMHTCERIGIPQSAQTHGQYVRASQMRGAL